MTLKPDTQAFIDTVGNMLSCPAEALSDPEASAKYLKTVRYTTKSATTAEAIAHMYEHTIRDGVVARVYVPEGTGPFPIVVYFHGGGWVSGDLDMHDATCRRIANRAKTVVFNVDYRLAPEHKFPVPFDDAYAATQWAQEHATEFCGDPSRLAVAGSSAGGNLAAAVALKARDAGWPEISLQVLIYAVLDSRLETASYRDFADGFLLTATQMRWYWQQYVSDESQLEDFRVSPAHAESLAGLPPAIIVTAEFDPLRDEGEEYAARLRDSGVTAETIRYEGQVHGFMALLSLVADAEIALNATTAKIAAHFG
jgi:acetyl esterase